MSKTSDAVLDTVAQEMTANPPSILAKTRAKYGAKRAEKQRVAILLSKSGLSKKSPRKKF